MERALIFRSSPASNILIAQQPDGETVGTVIRDEGKYLISILKRGRLANVGSRKRPDAAKHLMLRAWQRQLAK